MIRATIKKFTSPLKNLGQLQFSISAYLASLALEAPRHSLKNAAELSGRHSSQFSRLLKKHGLLAEVHLNDLSKKAVKQLSKAENELSKLCQKLPWKVVLIIDSTPQNRSSSQAENISKFNQGGGFWYGHRWTNVVLFIQGRLVPLLPIAYRSKKECRKLGIPHKTENELVCEYLRMLDLEEFFPELNPKDVVVLMDAGYDAKKIQKSILLRGWDFLMGIKSSRGLFITHENPKNFGETHTEMSIRQAFNRFKRRAQKITCSLPKLAGQKKRKTFSVKRLNGTLKGIKEHTMTFLFSKKIGHFKVKYLACSKVGVPTWKLIQTYSFRFYIELFHKETKQYLGFEDIAVQSFESVRAHTHWVYCAYDLLNLFYPDDLGGIGSKQKRLTSEYQLDHYSKMIQLSTRFGGAQQVKNFCETLFNSKISEIAGVS